MKVTNQHFSVFDINNKTFQSEQKFSNTLLRTPLKDVFEPKFLDIRTAFGKPVQETLANIVKACKPPKKTIVEEISETEFIELKQKIENYFGQSSCIINSLNKYNVQVINKFLSDKKLRENENLKQSTMDLAYYINTPENAQIFDKILSDEKLYENENVIWNADMILKNINTQHGLQIADKILSEEKLYNNKFFMNDAAKMIYFSETPEITQLKINIIDKFLSDEKIYSNKDLMNRIGFIINSIQNQYGYQIVERILSNEKLYNNSNLTTALIDILSYTKNSYQENLVNKILSDERLYNNTSIIDNTRRIINYAIRPEFSESKINIIDKILSDEKLYKNENIISNFANIIIRTDDNKTAQLRFDLIDKFLSDEKLYNNDKVKQNIGLMLDLIDNFYTAQTFNKILSDERLYNNENFMNKLDAISVTEYMPVEMAKKMNLIDKILSDEKLYKNKNIIDSLGNIIMYAYTPAKVEMINKILSDENLYGNENIMNYFWRETIPSCNNQNIDLICKILSYPCLYENKSINADIKAIMSIGQIRYPAYRKNIVKILDEYSNNKKLLKDEFMSENLSYLILNSDYDITDIKSWQDFCKVLKDAFANKNQLKTWGIDISDDIIKSKFNMNEMNAIEILGVSNFKAAFPLKLSGIKDLSSKVINLKGELTPEQLEVLLEKINPEKSLKYKKLQEEISELKKQYPEVSSSNNKEELIELQNRINTKTKEALDLRNNKCKLSPQKILEKIYTLCAVAGNNSKDINKFLDLIKDDTEANEAVWRSEVNKYIFNILHLDFNQNISDRLNLINSKYISEILSSGNSFKQDFKSLLELINESPTKTTKEIFDELPQNKITRKMFEQLRLDYDKYGTVDENLNVHVELKDSKAGNRLVVKKVDMNDIRHSLFLGNHVGCCTAIRTGAHSSSAIRYIKNKMVSAIEIVDGENSIGNTMCYIAKVNGEPALLLDNIELKTEYNNRDGIRDAIVEYAKKMCTEIGKPDMPIYAGSKRQKVNMKIYPEKECTVEIIGNTGNDLIYLDFDGGVNELDGTQEYYTSLYKIR